jgi:hypothetical protein
MVVRQHNCYEKGHSDKDILLENETSTECNHTVIGWKERMSDDICF